MRAIGTEVSALLVVTLGVVLASGACDRTAIDERTGTVRSRSEAVEVDVLLTDSSRWDRATSTDRARAAAAVDDALADFELLRLETFSCAGQVREIALFRHPATGLEFALLPGGTFSMGSPPTEPGRRDDEALRSTTIAGPFLMSRTECTVDAWNRLDGFDDVAGPGRLPRTFATWAECTKWCAAAGLRLPTEAEWEYACRAGTGTAWCFGDAADDAPMYSQQSDDVDFPMQPVGEKRPNAFGLFDVHGNAWEMCADRFAAYSASPVTGSDRATREAEVERVARGGIEYPDGIAARSAARVSIATDGDLGEHIGFRPAKSVSLGSLGSK